MSQKTTSQRTVGVVRADEVLTLKAFCREMEIGQHKLRKLKRAGLPIIKTGYCSYVRGCDWLEFLPTLSNPS